MSNKDETSLPADVVAETEPAQSEEQLESEKPNKSANREAAGYRVKLRETEEQLEAMTEDLKKVRTEVLHRKAVEMRLTKSRGLLAEAWQDSNLKTEDYFQAGELNEKKLREDLESLAETKPHYFDNRYKVRIPGEAEKPFSYTPPPGMEDFFRPPKRR